MRLSSSRGRLLRQPQAEGLGAHLRPRPGGAAPPAAASPPGGAPPRERARPRPRPESAATPPQGEGASVAPGASPEHSARAGVSLRQACLNQPADGRDPKRGSTLPDAARPVRAGSASRFPEIRARAHGAPRRTCARRHPVRWRCTPPRCGPRVGTGDVCPRRYGQGSSKQEEEEGTASPPPHARGRSAPG